MASQFAQIFKMDYDLFKNSVSSEFRKASEDIAAMNKMLEGRAEPLLSQRDWMGLGQQKFREEWESKIHPVLQRLQQALAEASNLAGQMEQIVHNAEQESAAALGTWRE